MATLDADDLTAIENALARRLGREVFPPRDMAFTPLVRVFRQGSMVYTDFDESDYDVERAVTYYVNTATGSDSNNGLTAGAALKTMTRAITLGNAQTSFAVILESKSGYLSGFGTTPINKPCSIKSSDGTMRYLANAQIGSNFSIFSGDVYSRAHSALHVWDCKYLDEHGAPSKLTQVADAAAVATLPGSFAVVSGTTYIQTQDSRELDDEIITATSQLINQLKITTGCTSLFVKGVDIVGATGTAFDCNNLSPTSVCFVNSRIDYTFSTSLDAFYILTDGTCITKNLSITNALKDGANYRPKTSDLVVQEIDFYSDNIGDVGADNTNASTTHLGTKICRAGGRYRARHKPIHDIQDGAESWCIDVDCGEAVAEGTGYTAASIAVGSDVDDTAKMWIDGGRFAGTARFTAFGTAQMYLRNVSEYGSTGNVEPYPKYDLTGDAISRLVDGVKADPPTSEDVLINQIDMAPLTIEIPSEQVIYFGWPTTGAVVTALIKQPDGSYVEAVGAVTQVSTETEDYEYRLAYAPADRLNVPGGQRLKFTDGTYTSYLTINYRNPVSAVTEQLDMDPLSIEIPSTREIYFGWPTNGASINAAIKQLNGSYVNTVGAVTQVSSTAGDYEYKLGYNLADRLSSPGSQRLRFTDGSYTTYLTINYRSPLTSVPAGDYEDAF